MALTTSGTYTFSPDVSEIISEAWERLQIEPETLRARHIKSSRRSINYLMIEWLARGFKQPWMKLQQITLAQGQIQVPLAAPAVDVFHVYLTRSGYDTEMYPVSETEYEAIPNKTQQGRPTMYWTNYQSLLTQAVPTPTLFLWQASQNSTDILNVATLQRAQDVGLSSNGMAVPYVWQEALVAGVAAKLARKWKPALYKDLAVEAGGLYKEAMSATREKASTHFRARFRF